MYIIEKRLVSIHNIYKCPKCNYEDEEYIGISNKKIKCPKCNTLLKPAIRKGYILDKLVIN